MMFSSQDRDGFTDRDDQSSIYKHQNTSVQTAGENSAHVKCLGSLLHSHQPVEGHQRQHQPVQHISYSGWREKRKPDLQKANIHKNTRKSVIYVGLLLRIFQVTAYWRLKKTLKISALSPPCRHCTRQTSGTLPSSTMSNWVCSACVTKKRTSRAAARCGSAD